MKYTTRQEIAVRDAILRFHSNNLNGLNANQQAERLAHFVCEAFVKAAEPEPVSVTLSAQVDTTRLDIAQALADASAAGFTKVEVSRDYTEQVSENVKTVDYFQVRASK